MKPVTSYQLAETFQYFKTLVIMVGNKRVAKESGLSPSTITRITQGKNVTVECILKCLDWLEHVKIGTPTIQSEVLENQNE